jgi:type I restriction enzyme S subunit
MSFNPVLLRKLLVETKDGEWGKEEPFDDSVEMAVIRGTDFDTAKESRLSGVPVRHIPSKAASRKGLQPFDILIETAGGSKGKPTGKTTFLRPALFERSSRPITCASFARFLRIDPELADPEFIFWYLQNLYSNGVIENYQVQHTGIARFQFTKFADSIEVELPSMGDQKQIAAFLGSIDERITLLREINATLEAIAQALFKSWFVDFDPVRAKAEGRQPEGMDTTTAALFPDSFEEFELGLVPKGWAVRSLDSIADYLNGLALQRFPPREDAWLPVIKIAQLRKGDTVGADRAGRDIKPEYVIQNGDVLFSWSGSLEVVIWCGGEGALNQHLFKVTSAEFPKWFYYLWTRQHLPAFQQIAASKATTMGHIQRKHLTEAKVVVPPSEVVQMIGAQIEPLLDRWLANAEQAKTLTQLRDTLLPRLISGQLRLPEAPAVLNDMDIAQ